MIYYLHAISKNMEDNLGIKEKVYSQVKALNDLGIETELKEIYRIDRWKKAIPFSSSSADWWNQKYYGINGLYIRYPLSDFQFIQFLKRTKKNNPGVKIIIEIPTYPYDLELNKNKVSTRRDVRYRGELSKYVDAIAVMTEENPEYVFGVKAIKIENGIDFDKYKLINTVDSENNCINLISVSGFRKWHGLDRVVRGLAHYYESGKNQTIVNAYLVGDGEASTEIAQMVSSYGLQNHVYLCGNKYGNELDDIYNQADIGIDALGMYRKNAFMSSSLKTREYMARGIPFIYSGEVTGLNSVLRSHTLCVPNDDTPLDIDKIVDFHTNLFREKNRSEVAKTIRSNAMQTVDIHITMKPVADYLKNE